MKWVAGAGFRAAVLNLQEVIILDGSHSHVGNTLTNSIMRLDWTLFLELQI
jgi:hypothetical protein